MEGGWRKRVGYGRGKMMGRRKRRLGPWISLKLRIIWTGRGVLRV